jgi:hypothetical protein
LGEEFAEYTAETPHIDVCVVRCGAEEEVGRAVPESHDELGEVGRRWCGGISGHAKIGDLQDAPVGEEEVGGLEISVEDVVTVEVGQGRCELVEKGFDFRWEERFWLVFEKSLEIVLEKRHDQEDAGEFY